MRTAAEVREAAGLSLEAAARRVRITPDYLRRVERRGCDSYALACRLSGLYGCRVDVFLGANPSLQRRGSRTN